MDVTRIPYIVKFRITDIYHTQSRAAAVGPKAIARKRSTFMMRCYNNILSTIDCQRVLQIVLDSQLSVDECV